LVVSGSDPSSDDTGEAGCCSSAVVVVVLAVVGEVDGSTERASVVDVDGGDAASFSELPDAEASATTARNMRPSHATN
jgi:hypothetical protein